MAAFIPPIPAPPPIQPGPQLDVLPGLQLALQQMERDRQAEREAEQFAFQQEQARLQNARADRQAQVSEGYLELGKLDRQNAERARRMEAETARKAELEAAWQDYLMAQRSGSPSLIAEAAARLRRLGLQDADKPGDPIDLGYGEEEPEISPSTEPIDPFEAPPEAPDGAKTAGGNVVFDGLPPEFGDFYMEVAARDPEAAEALLLEAQRDPSVISDFISESRKLDASGAPVEGQATAGPDNSGDVRPGGAEYDGGISVPGWVSTPEDLEMFLMLSGEGAPEPKAIEPEAVVPEEEPPAAASRGPQGARFRDPGRGTIYDSPGVSTGANPILVRESLSSLAEGAPSEEHKAAAERAIGFAERVAQGPGVTFEEAIEAGIDFYNKRAAEIEARGLQAMRSANRGGRGGATGPSEKWTYKLDKDKITLLDEYIDKTTQSFNVKALNDADTALAQLVATASQGTGVADTMAVTQMIRTTQDRISDQDMRQALQSGGFWAQLSSLAGYVAQGGEKDEEYMRQVRELGAAMQQVVAQRRRDAAAFAANRIAENPFFRELSPEEQEEAQRYVRNTIGFSGGGSGGGGPAPKAAPSNARAGELRDRLGY